MDPEAGPQLPDCIRPHSPWGTRHADPGTVRGGWRGGRVRERQGYVSEPLGSRAEGGSPRAVLALPWAGGSRERAVVIWE